ncbi:glycosyltransferase family 4 protein [uncultured Rikenella sp.]|uniref:glycosyltransferase family 4 protein n=2 Tax=uncultured Rikenella sp. TaxID=368003 RepID=UPI00343E60F6
MRSVPMTHILFVIAHLQRTGPVNILYNLCRGLLQAGFQTTIVTLRAENADSRIDDFRTLGVLIHSLNATLLDCETRTRHITSHIRGLIKLYRPDIIHAHGYHAVLSVAPLSPDIPSLATLHNRATEDFPNSKGKLIGKYMLTRYMRALRKFRNVVAVSSSTSMPYKQYGLNNLEIINNGIDTFKFSPVTKHHSEKPVFALSGRLEPEKGILDILQAFAQLSYRLIVLGSGSLLEPCRHRFRDTPTIQFMGHTDQVENYLQQADYYISNSQSEGLSLAVCEAISCGLWPVLSDIPSHHDILDTCHIGTFIPRREPTTLSIIQAVETALKITSSPNELHQAIEEHFSEKRMTNDYIHLYNRLTNGTL